MRIRRNGLTGRCSQCGEPALAYSYRGKKLCPPHMGKALEKAAKIKKETEK